MSPERIPGTLNLVLTATAAAACCGALWIASHAPPWQGVLAAIVFSFVNNTMFSLLHESVHGIAHENRRVNESIGRFAAAFFPTSLSLQRVFHLGHHAHNRTEAEQFDYIRPTDRPLLKRAQWYAILTGLYWVFVPLGGLAYLVTPSVLLRTRASSIATQTGASSVFAGVTHAPRWTTRLELLFTIALQAALVFALDLSLRGWLLCYAAFALNWSSLQYTDHAFSKLDVRDGAWNLRVNPLTRLLFLNYHHHLAHHRHPHVPWIHLGRYVDDAEPRPSFWSIYRRMWRGPERMPAELAVGGWQLAGERKERGRAAASRQPPTANGQLIPLCLAFAALFALCYGGAAWIAGQYASLPAWDFAFEHRIPFVPSLAIVYLTITPALLLAPFRFRTRAALGPLFAALCVETLIATLFFLLFPQKTAFVRPEVTGWARGPFELADALNLDFNEFPSLHVAFAVSLAWAYRGRVWLVWAFAVAVSAWLMYEHHLLDIAGGVALAAMVMPVALRERTWVELCCLWQCARFSRRHVRYFVIFLAIWLPSLLHWRRYRAVRYGFCAAQWIDDLLDGDRACDREPLAVIDELIANDFASHDSLSRLTRAFLAEVDENARSEFIALVRTMQRDRVRALERTVWSEAELDAHHRETFARSVDLMLITAGCTARASDVPSLIRALAWCSVFRDLDDDLRKGLINVPRHAWQTAAYDDWVRDAHRDACDALERSAGEIARLDDAASRRILAIFQKSIVKFAAKRRQHVIVEEKECPQST